MTTEQKQAEEQEQTDVRTNGRRGHRIRDDVRPRYLKMIEKLEYELGCINEVASLVGLSSTTLQNHRRGAAVSQSAFQKVKNAYISLVADTDGVAVLPPADAPDSVEVEAVVGATDALRRAWIELEAMGGGIVTAIEHFDQFLETANTAAERCGPVLGTGIKAAVEAVSPHGRALREAFATLARVHGAAVR